MSASSVLKVVLTESRVLKGRTAIITTIIMGKMEIVFPEEYVVNHESTCRSHCERGRRSAHCPSEPSHHQELSQINEDWRVMRDKWMNYVQLVRFQNHRLNTTAKSWKLKVSFSIFGLQCEIHKLLTGHVHDEEVHRSLLDGRERGVPRPLRSQVSIVISRPLGFGVHNLKWSKHVIYLSLWDDIIKN